MIDKKPLTRRAAAALALAAVAVTATATGAAAHVTVQPATTEQGGFSVVAFRVPTERDDASTTKVEVTFPTEQPLAFVSVKPHPGWSYEVQKATLPAPVEVEGTEITEAVSTITWTADDRPRESDRVSTTTSP